jgi:hypothetical protein
VPTVFTSDAKKAVRKDATAKVSLELVKHEGRQLAASRFEIRQERRPVFLYRSIKRSRFGAMARVRACTDGRVGVTARCWLRGRHQQEFSATRRYLLLTKCGILRSRPSRADRANKTVATLGNLSNPVVHGRERLDLSAIKTR